MMLREVQNRERTTSLTLASGVGKAKSPSLPPPPPIPQTLGGSTRKGHKTPNRSYYCPGSAPLPSALLCYPRGPLPGGLRVFLGHGSEPRRDAVMGAVEAEPGPWGGCLRAAGASGGTSRVTR